MDTIVKKAKVNAPLDKTIWLQADWGKVNQNVRRIQNRIVKAVKANEWRKVRNLQRLLTRALSAKLLAVRRVVDNSGNRTPGIDGIIWYSSQAKSKAVLSLRGNPYKAKPLKRVYINKTNGKKRPLGIPTVLDRAMQALHKLGLEPITETLADLHSYGFRPERSTADAIGQCFNLLSHSKDAQWVLEADIQGCFDNIHHEWLLKHTPMNGQILKTWLKSGFMEEGSFNPTEAGTPQGGIISPILMNWTLDGLGRQLGERFGEPNSPKSKLNKVFMVRYADDFVITGINPSMLENEVKPFVERFLGERGLTLSPSKTRITSIHAGFDFLGQTIRKYQNRKLLIIPSESSQQAFRKKIKQTIKALRTAPQEEVINTLNPIIRGWGHYHQHVVSKQVFTKLDEWLWQKLWKWSYRRHNNKTKRWVAEKYYHTKGQRRWEFSCYAKNANGIPVLKSLYRLASIPIRRHIKVKGAANPYELDWELYFEQRQDSKMKKNLIGRTLTLYKRQRGICPECRLKITLEERWNTHHILEKIKGGSDKLTNLVLLHPHCHKQLHSCLKAGLHIQTSPSHA